MVNSTIPVIAIDGPGGSGKGTIAYRIAGRLGFHLLDSGAIYRIIGLAARQGDVPLHDEPALATLTESLDIAFKLTDNPENPLSIWLNAQDVTLQIRTNQAGVDASIVAPLASVREVVMKLQRSFRQAPGLVADGRDMGTVVFTDAAVKVYLTATAEERAKRRYKQLKDKDISVSLQELLKSIQIRDELDMKRDVAPLRAAPDAVIIDSTALSTSEVFQQVLTIVEGKLG
ncbi:MAG: (d)CMP kinase [Gammaproteobacteria bacterium]|nr:(d)CMP kinase [Gammaproteobacteria bacterium]